MERGAVQDRVQAADGCPVAYPSVEGAECPYPFYSWAHREHPVYQLPGKSVYFVSRHEDVRFVTEHPEIFSSVGKTLGSKPEPQPTTASGVEIRAMMESDGADHDAHRKFTSQLLEPRAMRGYRPMIEAISSELIDSFIERGHCDFVTDYANKLPGLVTARVAGLPDSLVEDLRAWGQIEASGAPFLPPERFAEHLATRNSMISYVRKALEERLQSPRNDGLTHLLQVQQQRDGQLSLPYVTLQAAVFLAGGTTTTAHMLAMALLLLIQHPEQMQKVASNSKAIGPFIEEALRLESPVQWVTRRVATDTVLGGAHMASGSHVIIGFGAANRDDAEFQAADRFDAERKGVNRHVAFGRGPHTCIGQLLARTEMMIAFEHLLARLKNIALAPGADLSHIESPSFRGLKSLRIHFDPGPRIAPAT
ncbi:MAG: cytochrome P450 [Steroidobacteraceae bacterium]